MRICVLTDEVLADFDPAPFLEGFDFEIVTLTDPVIDVLRALDARKEFDLYLNLCEGYELDGTEEYTYQGIDVVKALEELNLPFTGVRLRDSLIQHAKRCKPPRMHTVLTLPRDIGSSRWRKRSNW